MIEYTVKVDGSRQEWYINGKRHREDGPAVIIGDIQAWYINDNLHREDGPAIIDGDAQAWCNNGILHREDGPAFSDGDYFEWWVNNHQLSEEEFNNRKTKEMTVAEIIDELGYNIKVVK